MNAMLFKKQWGFGSFLFRAVALFGLLASCSVEEDLPSVSSLRIELSGSLGQSGISASTRGVVDGSASAALPLSFVRRDQQTDGSYPSYTTVSSALSANRAAVVGTTAGTITFASGSEQYYPVRESNNNTALLGWYPQVGKGSTYAVGKVTFSIADGVTDVMLTKEQTGNKSTTVGAFTFEHQLSQIQVKAKAVDAAAATNWGTVTGVTLKGVKNSCTVTLPTVAPSSTALTPDFGSTTANLALKAIGSDTNSTLVATIPTTAGTTGNAFCYGLFPPTGTNTLSLDVTTQKGGTRSVTATLSSGTITKGNIYTVTLEFKSTAITPTATISSWSAGSGANVEM